VWSGELPPWDALVGVLAFLAACSGNANESPTAEGAGAKADGPCPATRPNGNTPPGEQASPDFFGNGKLWTVTYYPRLVATARNLEPDGSIAEKFPWWADGVQGELKILGRRLYGAAPRLRARINSGVPQTGFSGDAFWASAIIFPTVRAAAALMYGAASATFTTV
jgi:hypothetical protein